MAYSQRLEHLMSGLRHSVGRQPSGIWNRAGQQAHSGDEYKLLALSCREGKAEHAAHILDANHFGSEYIRHANWIDKLGHGTPHPHRADLAWCAHGLSRARRYPSSSNKRLNISSPSFVGVRQIGAAS